MADFGSKISKNIKKVPKKAKKSKKVLDFYEVAR